MPDYPTRKYEDNDKVDLQIDLERSLWSRTQTLEYEDHLINVIE